MIIIIVSVDDYRRLFFFFFQILLWMFENKKIFPKNFLGKKTNYLNMNISTNEECLKNLDEYQFNPK